MQDHTSNLLEFQLHKAIIESLENYLISNSVFLSERLYYQSKTEENLSLLCECHLMENRPFKVISLLKDSEYPKNQYLLGVAYLRLNKPKEAEKAFTACVNLEFNTGYAYYMLGVCQDKQQNFQAAASFYLKALEKNPTIWVAYEKLCLLGSSVVPNKIFNDRRNYELPKQIHINFLNYSQKVDDLSFKTNSKILPYNSNYFEPDSTSLTNGFDRNLILNPPQYQIEIGSFLNTFALPIYYISRLQAKEAINYLTNLPPNHYCSGWAQLQIAKCHMLLRDHCSAEETFQKALEIEPFNLECMGYYSICLWQLKKRMDLALLSHKALNLSKLETDAWIVVGNCYSLENEHKEALKCFSRALQLKPDHSYLHFLCGQEYIVLEDPINAKQFFEIALILDKRNYNAWWGLGNIHYKQEKYEKAIEYFQRAVMVHPYNSLFYTYLGMAFNCRRIYGESLKHFDLALDLDEKNYLCRFQKANVLFQLEQYDLALIELEKLKLVLPKETPVFILMAKIYKKIGRMDKMSYFMNLALDLDPHSGEKIKETVGFNGIFEF